MDRSNYKKRREEMREAAERAREQHRLRESGEANPEAPPASPDEAPPTPAPLPASELVRFASDPTLPSVIEVEDAPGPASDEAECPACAETIKARAKVCKHCGHELGKPVKGRRTARARGPLVIYKPFLAGLLGVWWPGFGHFYCGESGRGMVFMIAGVVLLVAAAFFPPIAVGLIALQVYSWSDAVDLARRKNVAAAVPRR